MQVQDSGLLTAHSRFSALSAPTSSPHETPQHLALSTPAAAAMSQTLATFKPALILHGGAGNLKRATLPPELYAAYHASLQSYLRSTHKLLINGASALDAAVHAVSLMEDDELFNCGRGSVFTTAGTIEMEASVMVTSVQGSTANLEGTIKRGAGVMGVKKVRHPIRLARESLLRAGYHVDGKRSNDGGSLHSQLHGSQVEELAREWGLELKSEDWFWTKRRWDEHQRGLKGEAEPLSLSQGTVGCVCLDQWGNLAVATSTGGMTNKLPGRIGDTPTLGAGFWAESWDEIVPDVKLVVGAPLSSSLGGYFQEAKGWLADCLPPFLRGTRAPAYTSLSTGSQMDRTDSGFEKGALSYEKHTATTFKKRAMAVSGTGNGDSFLRVAAAHTAAAMLRFSAPGLTLADAITAVAGPGGELQRSAGQRWNITGEGEGGIIGIEADFCPAARGQLRRGKVVFNFNSGGMWRAWIEEDSNGRETERIMVFREEYQ